jgi:hypothetical protein
MFLVMLLLLPSLSSFRLCRYSKTKSSPLIKFCSSRRSEYEINVNEVKEKIVLGPQLDQHRGKICLVLDLDGTLISEYHFPAIRRPGNKFNFPSLGYLI